MINPPDLHAIHVMWSKPQIEKYGRFHLDDYELFIMMASALSWRNLQSAKITAFIDKPTYDFLTDMNATWVWNDIDFDMLINFEKEVHTPAEHYPTAGKSYVLATLKPPFVFIDHDLVILEQVPNHFFDRNLVTAHFERTAYPTYPNYEDLTIPSEYEIRKDLDWSSEMWTPNTSIVWMNDGDFQNKYREELIHFINHNGPAKKDFLAQGQYLYPDQRLFGQIAKKSGINLVTFHDFVHPFSPEEPWKYLSSYSGKTLSEFSHLWFRKRALRRSRILRGMYLKNLMQRLKPCVAEHDLVRLIKNPYFSELIQAMEQAR